MQSSTEAVNQSIAESYATRDEMEEAIRGVTSGVTDEVLSLQRKATGDINKRVDDVLADIVGLDQTKKTVTTLAKDMEYLLAHVDNITACGADGGLYITLLRSGLLIVS